MSSCFRGLVIVAIALFAAGASAQKSAVITGVVSDPTGASVAGAHVELMGGARSTMTDSQGRYQFEAVPPGEYTVHVAAPGFLPLERRVSAASPGSTVADFRLEVQTLQEDVVVTVEPLKAELEAERAATPGAVSVLDGEELYSRHVTGMADMLRYVPGVFSESSYGSDELFFSSRGSNLDATDYDKNGVKLLQDGLPVTTADGNNHNRIIDPLSARYITVARGANALTYGASTLGGAIDFTSPTARNSAPLSVFLDGGSHGSLNGRVTAGGANDRLDGLVTLESRQWDGYRNHSGQKRWGLYGNAGWQPSPGANVQLFATYVYNDQRLPGTLTRSEADLDPDQASDAALAGDYGKVVKTARLATRATWMLGADATLSAGVSYEGQSLFHPIVSQIFVDFDGSGPNPPVEVFSLLIDTDHRDLGAMVRYDRRIGAHDLLVGLNYGDGSVQGGNYRNLSGRKNGISEHVDNTADSLEVFVADRWRVSSRMTAVLGAQLVSAARDVRITNADTGAVSNPSERYSSVNPRAGIIFSLNEAGDLYGNVSRLFEAPTTFEMQDDVRGGNATLEPMSGTVAEVGWRSASSPSPGVRWTWDLSAYYARISNEILSLDDPGAPGNSLSVNVDETTHAGIETVVGASFTVAGAHRIEPRVSFTLNRFHFDGDPVYGDNRLPAAPAYAARGEALYRHARGFYAGPTFDFIGDRYADFTNTYRVGGHTLMGLRAGVSGPRWEWFGEVRNLFGEDYVASLSVRDVAGPDARVLNAGSPRSAYTGVRVSF
jgi:iron complex outermembrane recepter protein